MPLRDRFAAPQSEAASIYEGPGGDANRSRFDGVCVMPKRELMHKVRMMAAQGELGPVIVENKPWTLCRELVFGVLFKLLIWTAVSGLLIRK